MATRRRYTAQSIRQKPEQGLRTLVRLGHHSRSCLLKDIELRQLGTFRRHIYIHDPALRRLEIHTVDG